MRQKTSSFKQKNKLNICECTKQQLIISTSKNLITLKNENHRNVKKRIERKIIFLMVEIRQIIVVFTCILTTKKKLTQENLFYIRK